MRSESKNILITGGAGFIGSHLAEHLLAQEHSVHIIDDLSTGSMENIGHILSDKCTLQEQPLASAITSSSDLEPFDEIFHLAAAVGVQLVVDQPESTIETNILDTAALLRAAAPRRIPVLIASSSEVYGKSNRIPFSEDDDVTYGSTHYSRWSYAMSKAIDEYLALAYHRTHDLPVVIARLFNTVGPRQVGKFGMVIPRFVSAALANQPLQIYGDGNQTRCFCHVANVVNALTQLLRNSATHGNVYNVGSDHEISINVLAQQIIDLANSSSSIEHIPYETAYRSAFDDLQRRVPNLTRICAVIDFSPTISLTQILTELISLARDDCS